MPGSIIVRGARIHNLQGLDVEIPHGQFVALCGVSGAGKSSLAVDTLFAEGQRRYIDSFHPYARQFLQRISRPPAEALEGIPPSVCLRGTHARFGRRARVGSVTEASDYLRLLFAQLASPACPQCGYSIRAVHVDDIADRLRASPAGMRFQIGFRLVDWDAEGTWASVRRLGFSRGLQKYSTVAVADVAQRQISARADDFLIVDRLKTGSCDLDRLRDSLEAAFEFGRGTLYLWSEMALPEWTSSPRDIDGSPWFETVCTRSLRCAKCQISLPPPHAKLFSDVFGEGVCPQCEGYGNVAYYDLERMVPDPELSIRQGAIAPWNTPAYRQELDRLLALADTIQIPVDVSFRQLTPAQREIIWHGVPEQHFAGLAGFFRNLERRKYKLPVRVFAARWRSYRVCEQCGGSRRNAVANAYRLAGYTIGELESLPIAKLAPWLANLGNLGLSPRKTVLLPLLRKLDVLQDVGLYHLSLDRPMNSLSRGESRRVQLAAICGSDLVHLLYVLEDPSLSLHPLDIERVSATIDRLHRRGNTVLVIDHDWRMLSRAERLLEIGPAGGKQGGRIVADRLLRGGNATSSLPSGLIAGRSYEIENKRSRDASGETLVMCGATGGNLKNFDIEIPLNRLVVVCGVSGAGKSTLIERTLYRAVARQLGKDVELPLPFRSIRGTEGLTNCERIDAEPFAKSSRSNLATYVQVFPDIRRVFAETSDAKHWGLDASSFSFNSKQGQCPKCLGSGCLVADMHFLADAQWTCDECGGTRFRPEVLKVRYRDRTIHDVLQLTAREAFSFFRDHRSIQQGLTPLIDVGLDYLCLGQTTAQLSAGECQRLKLAYLLKSARQARTLYVIDEPTAGLHDRDVTALLDCFESLLAVGHSLIAIDNRATLVANADWIIEMGPGAGEEGGCVVACGKPRDIAVHPASIIARYHSLSGDEPRRL